MHHPMFQSACKLPLPFLNKVLAITKTRRFFSYNKDLSTSDTSKSIIRYHNVPPEVERKAFPLPQTPFHIILEALTNATKGKERCKCYIILDII